MALELSPGDQLALFDIYIPHIKLSCHLPIRKISTLLHISRKTCLLEKKSYSLLMLSKDLGQFEQ